jgi:hypothetical protein
MALTATLHHNSRHRRPDLSSAVRPSQGYWLTSLSSQQVTYLNSVVMPDPGGHDTSSIATDSADEE